MDSKINELREIVQTSKRIVFFGGAGVSTESGVPDFRSESGLYNSKKKYGRSPEEMISYSFFIRETEIFFDYYKSSMIYPDARPNDAHRTLARWEKEGKMAGVVTQNIDGLHQLAGSKNVKELHGSVNRNYCMDCGAFYDLNYVMDPNHCKNKDGESGYIPFCEKCGGIVKPDVVLYGEPLDQSVMADAISDISSADTMIVGGTSLVVYPAAGLINYFRGDKIILINKLPTAYDGKADLVITEPIGKVFSILN